MKKQSSPLIDLIFSIILPSVILINLSDDAYLGAKLALVIALLFPFSLGLYEVVRYRSANIFAIIGLISISLTGGIGLLQLDNHWFAVKEAAIPAAVGIGLLIYSLLGNSLVQRIFFNTDILNREKIIDALEQHQRYPQMMACMSRANYFLCGTFFFSALMNYLLAKWVVISPTGSEAFNEELGRLTLLSYPVIALPSLLMMFGIIYFLINRVKRYTGLKLNDLIVQ